MNVVSSVSRFIITLKCSKCLANVVPILIGGPFGCPRGLLNSGIQLESHRQDSHEASGLTWWLTYSSVEYGQQGAQQHSPLSSTAHLAWMTVHSAAYSTQQHSPPQQNVSQCIKLHAPLSNRSHLKVDIGILLSHHKVLRQSNL